MTALVATRVRANRRACREHIMTDNLALSFVLRFIERMAVFVAQKPENPGARASGTSCSTWGPAMTFTPSRCRPGPRSALEVAAGLQSHGKRRQRRRQRQRAVGKRFNAVTGIPVCRPLALGLDDHQDAADLLGHPDAA